MDAQDQPKIYEIHDHTLEVLMHPSVLELHAVRGVRTPHGDGRQLHLKVQVMCGRKEVIADVLVDTGAQVSLVRNGLFRDTGLKSSDPPVRLKVANGGIMGGGAREAEVGLEFWEHDRFDRPDQAKRLTPHGKFHEVDLSDWDIIMGYDFMVSNSAGALPDRATLIRGANERLSWLSTHYASGGSQWTRDEEEKIIRAVKAAGIKSKGGDGEHLQEYGLSRDADCRMMEGLGMDTPSTDVLASREAPKLQKCARYWHKGDSAWNKHWGAERWGHLHVHGAHRDSERIVNKTLADRAKGVLVLTGLGSGDACGEVLRSKIDSIALNEFVFAPDEEIFMDATGTSLPSAGQAWSTYAYYVDGVQCHPTDDEALIRRIQAVPMRVMFEESNDPKVEVKTLSFDEIDRVVHYMKDRMHDRVAAKQARSRVKSPHWWDDQNLITGKFTKKEFVARVMDHMADQDETVGSNPPACNFPRSGIGSKPNIPFNIQEFRKLLAGLQTHDVEDGMTDEEMSQGDPEESCTAIRSVVTVPTAAAQEARKNPIVDELRERLARDYPGLFSGVANKNRPDRGRFGTVRIKLKPNPKVYRHREYQLQGERAEAMKKLLKEFIEREWKGPSDSEWASQAFTVPKKEKGEWQLVVDY